MGKISYDEMINNRTIEDYNICVCGHLLLEHQGDAGKCDFCTCKGFRTKK